MANNNGFDPENIEENLISSDGEINSGNLDNEPALEEPLQYIEEDIYLEEVSAEPQGLVIEPDAIEVTDSFVQPMAFGDFILMSTQGVGDPDDGIGGGGPLGTPPGTYNKDIIITPGRLNTNGTNADRYSQIDVKFSADDAYLGVVRSSEKKASIYNFAEAYTISATSYDFPILAIGGSWNAGAGNSTFAPSTTWGGSTGLSLIQIDSQTGKGAGLVLRPAISQIEASLYNNIGFNYYNKGEGGKAREYFEKCLVIKLKTLGGEHPDVATSCNNIGLTWNKKGEYDKALECFEKCLAIRLKTLGGEHPHVATSYYHIGKCYDALTRKELALDYFVQSAEICKSNPEASKNGKLTIWSVQNVLRIAKELGKENEIPEWMRNLQC